jgi:hypothetical protein
MSILDVAEGDLRWSGAVVVGLAEAEPGGARWPGPPVSGPVLGLWAGIGFMTPDGSPGHAG